jgi:hypothetical protein
MTDLTQVTVPTVEDVAKWYKLKEQLTELTAAEAMLRRRLADHFFPTPTEGSAENKYPLNDGTGAVLQMDHKIYRTVLEPELDAYKAALKVEGNNLPKLTEEERKACDTFLNIKPGMPDLKVGIPKRG